MFGNSLSTLYQYLTVLSAHGATDFVERLYECPMGKRISAPDVHLLRLALKCQTMLALKSFLL